MGDTQLQQLSLDPPSWLDHVEIDALAALAPLTKSRRQLIAHLAKRYTPRVLAEALVRAGSSEYLRDPYTIVEQVATVRMIQNRKRLVTMYRNLDRRLKRFKHTHTKRWYALDDRRHRAGFQIRLIDLQLQPKTQAPRTKN